MFGSQALETAIGLAVMFFVLATASSAVVEGISRLLAKRATDLERTIAAMLEGTSTVPADVDAATAAFRRTSVYRSARAATGRRFTRYGSWWRGQGKPSYLSARAFADAVVEMAAGAGDTFEALPAGLRARLGPIVHEAGGDLVRIKAGLEHWFDDTMARLGGAYKRWSMALLFALGLVFAVAANASTFDVAERLWRDPVTREAVADAAAGVTAPQAGESVTEVARRVEELDSLGLPIGWTDGQWDALWDDTDRAGDLLGTAAGWVVTALLVMFGAPFWYDVLGKLVSLRSSGGPPPAASADAASASASAGVRAGAAPPHGPAAAGGSFAADLRAAVGPPPPGSG